MFRRNPLSSRFMDLLSSNPAKNKKTALDFLKKKGFEPDRLYMTDPAFNAIFGRDAADSSEDEALRLLKFFQLPMSPGYLIRNVDFSEDMIHDLVGILERKLIQPVGGVPFTMPMDPAKWEYYRGLGVRSPVSEIQLNITNKCVNRCRMCRKYEWDQIDLPVEKIRELIRELSASGPLLLILSGGEPFLHDGIEEILDIAANIETLVFTSGAVPISDMLLKKLKRIQFSIDALDPDIYRIIRGPGNVETVRENVLRAKEAGCGVTVTAVTQRANVLHIPEIIDFCKKAGVPFLPGAAHSYDDLAFYDLSKRPLPGQCVVPLHHCLIDPAGDVFVCCHQHEDNTDYSNIDRRYVLGNIFQSSFPEIWSSERAIAIKNGLLTNRADFCRGCYRYLLENDSASFSRQNTTKEIPSAHTYFFPLELVSDLKTGE